MFKALETTGPFPDTVRLLLIQVFIQVQRFLSSLQFLHDWGKVVSFCRTLTGFNKCQFYVWWVSEISCNLRRGDQHSTLADHLLLFADIANCRSIERSHCPWFPNLVVQSDHLGSFWKTALAAPWMHRIRVPAGLRCCSLHSHALGVFWCASCDCHCLKEGVGGDARPGRGVWGVHNSSTDWGWSLCGWEGEFQMKLEALSVSLLTSWGDNKGKYSSYIISFLYSAVLKTSVLLIEAFLKRMCYSG